MIPSQEHRMSVSQGLPVIDSAVPADDGACCEACASSHRTAGGPPAAAVGAETAVGPAAAETAVVAAGVLTRPQPEMLSLHPRGPRPPLIDRSRDRHITVAGLALAAGFLALAAASVVVPNLHGRWLPLHLVLAGAATVAIGAVMPFFASALVASPPAPGPVRVAILGLLAAGALATTIGFGTATAWLAVAGGLLFISGLVTLLSLTLRVLRGSAGVTRRVFTIVYGTAIVNVIVGASIATLFLGGQRDIVLNWATVKPAHAWLNLFGFVGLVICASLIHLFPTVVGARMDRSRWSAAAVIALAIAPPLVALGYIVNADVVAQAGALVLIAGTGSLLVMAFRTWSGRSRWTTDGAWHTMAIGSLWSGLGWLSAGVAVAAAAIARNGAQPAGWSVTELIAPLGVGFVIQVIIGAWTHLLPAIGPGTPGAHARARRRLGALAWPRLVMLNTGAASLFAGSVTGVDAAVRAGLLLAGAAVLASIAIFAVTVVGIFARGAPTGDGTSTARRGTGGVGTHVAERIV